MLMHLVQSPTFVHSVLLLLLLLWLGGSAAMALRAHDEPPLPEVTPRTPPQTSAPLAATEQAATGPIVR
jgi:hypothetical protein